MEGCPMSKSKFKGTCATCAQVDDCVLLELAKVLEEIKVMLRDVEKRVKKIEADRQQ